MRPSAGFIAIAAPLRPIRRKLASRVTGSGHVLGGVLFGSASSSSLDLERISYPDPERKWFTDVCGNFAKCSFEQFLENVRERNRDRQVRLNPHDKSQELSNQRGSSKKIS